MKKLLTFIFLFCASVVTGQSYSFINGAWGYEKCQEELCGDSNMPSELYWRDSIMSTCIVNGEQHISQSFHVSQVIDNSFFDAVDYLVETQEGYIVKLSGYKKGEKIVILSAYFYYEGFVIGILSYPILY
jgi:hypothetical protein